MIMGWVINMSQFIKCFKEDYDKVLNAGHTFLYESNGVYWFSLNNSVTFTFSDSDNIILTDSINL